MRSVALALTCAAVLGCARRHPPNVIVIVLDAVRADRVGSRLMPFLDGLAHRGVVFRNAFAAATDTAPSVASLFTARYPSQHGVAGREDSLPDEERTLAEALGMQAFGFAATRHLPKEHGWAQGFETWSADGREKGPASELRKRVFSWIDVVRGWHSTKPLFLYLHYVDAHAPYAPPARYGARFARDAGIDADAANRKALEMRFAELAPTEIAQLTALYDAEVAYLDGEMRKLFAGLAHRHLLDDAVVVVTADHGEELGGHGLVGHGFGLYDQELRVPLLLFGHGVPANHVVEAPVSLVDVAPTVLALAGRNVEPRFAGHSLVPLFADGARADDVLAQLPRPPARLDPRRHTAGLIRGSQRLLVLADAWAARLGEAELYDVANDPDQTRPLGYVGGPQGLPAGSPALGVARDMLAALHAADAALVR